MDSARSKPAPHHGPVQATWVPGGTRPGGALAAAGRWLREIGDAQGGSRPAQASIRRAPGRAPFDPRLFGSFLEHLGYQVLLPGTTAPRARARPAGAERGIGVPASDGVRGVRRGRSPPALKKRARQDSVGVSRRRSRPRRPDGTRSAHQVSGSAPARTRTSRSSSWGPTPTRPCPQAGDPRRATSGLRFESGIHPPLALRPWTGSSESERLVRPPGLEPGTLGLEGRCSIHLSYGRVPIIVPVPSPTSLTLAPRLPRSAPTARRAARPTHRRPRVYNRPVTPEAPSRARLSTDTDLASEQRQIAAWRAASTVEIARLIAGAANAARSMALAGLRQRHPEASPEELTARLAFITLGPDLARRVYPELNHLDP